MDNIRLLYIDLFCGAGGTSTGVEKANYKERKCAKVIACVNHDANAIASHAANHPEAQHYTEDMRTLDLRPLAEHTAEMRRMYPMAKVVLWASLECTNFSRAKGGQPRDADSRTLAEHLFRYIEALTPDYIQIENVEEFMSWGDLDENGKPLSPKTLERIYAGLIKFVAGGKDSFLIKYNSVNKKTGKHIPPSIDEPCPTVACQNRLGIANIHFLAKHFSGHPESKVSSVDNVAGTITTVDHHSLVGAEFLSAYYGNGNNHSVNMPSPTITTKDRFSVVKPEFIANNYSGGGQLSSLDNPCPAVMTNPKQNVIACKWYLMNPQFSNAGGSVEKPCFTLIAKMDKKPPYLIATECGQLAIEIYETDSGPMRKIKEFMALYGIVDIKMRMLKIIELKRIMGFPENYTLIGTQADQKKFIGNAVEVNIARVLCEALVEEIVDELLKVA